ncbi:phosphoglycerate dehydrogenase [Clostridium aestuarii]|uniref:D-3-phosphoglycerate dehydrogenase n=1 Tax=Clostridium aestuarii TaxID=338193 RepID=A0ABT4D0Q2_9CLOT|nr:phosphoglycerate dehydrogenase [Clostridium aestuarii]MCY6484818.1 phosphoglycerate dehydrogenase [Clostridium aestuarii]
MRKARVIIAEKINELGIELLQKEMDVDICIGISREELLKKIHEYDALIVRSATLVNAELMDKASKLKIVGRAGNGTDNIDIPEATKRGIIVANTPDSNSISAGEIAIGLMMAQARSIPHADRDMKAGNWNRNNFEGTELYNKTLGILGLGRIGSLVATRMKAFGMKIVSYDPYISDERFKRFGVEKMETLDDLLKISDFISIHTPRTEETIGMISYEQIKLMKDNVRITNAARGKIIDEEALYDGLKSGKVASAGMDVHSVEPRHESPLYEFDNMIVTPHIGANTREAQQNVGITIAQQVINGLKGEIVPNAVNLPAINRDELQDIKPYIDLMEKLGKIYYQLNKELVKFVEINYWGEVAAQDIDMINIAFLKGLLEPILKDKVNYINARVLAEKSGIGIKTKKVQENYNNYSNLITIKITNKNLEEFTLAGTLAANKEGKLLEIQGYEVDVKPSRYMIFVQNKDVPGVIGQVGTIVGKENVNVATMQVGRKTKGKLALMVLNVDDEVSKETLKKFKEVDNIIWVKGTII